MSELNTFHSTTIEINGTGCLIRGRSGSGKSLLALDLLNHYGEKAALIADDQTVLTVHENQLIATCPPILKGKIELRGRGLIEWPTINKTRVEILIDLVEILPRMPEKYEFSHQLFGIDLERILLPERAKSDPAHQRMLVEAGLYDRNRAGQELAE